MGSPLFPLSYRPSRVKLNINNNSKSSLRVSTAQVKTSLAAVGESELREASRRRKWTAFLDAVRRSQATDYVGMLIWNPHN